MANSCVALIPARAGSKRIPHKNTRRLGAHPLIAYAIATARESAIFTEIVVCTDDPHAADIALWYGARAQMRDPSPDDEPDIVWVKHALSIRDEDCFAILRPTAPFRTADTIRLAWADWLAGQPADSLRAVQLVTEHPGKMWRRRWAGGRYLLVPLLPFGASGEADPPWHSRPTQTLPTVYVQNASLEIAWRKTVESGSIAGVVVVAFETKGVEGFDLNTLGDWFSADKWGASLLPDVPEKPYAATTT